jgi:hypothetical protein
MVTTYGTSTWYCVSCMLKILLVLPHVEMYARVFVHTVTSYKSSAEQNHHCHVIWLCLHSKTEAFYTSLSLFSSLLFRRWVHPWWFCCLWWWGPPVFCGFLSWWSWSFAVLIWCSTSSTAPTCSTGVTTAPVRYNTTVNLGVLYPTNVHQNLAKGTKPRNF